MDNQIQLNEALRAQKALRDAAGMAEETFLMPAFIGMVSDEIEQLRKKGLSDEKIASLITSNSKIKVTATELAKYYATPEARQTGHHE